MQSATGVSAFSSRLKKWPLPLAIGCLAFLAGCKEKNQFVAAPPAKVTVINPVQRPVTRYLEVTGIAAAVNSVDLMARVQGVLEEVNYKDGSEVKQGTNLFIIEPKPYLAKLQSAQAQEASSEAKLAFQEGEYNRQAQLSAKAFASVSVVEQQKSNRDSANADLLNAKSSVEQADIQYSYTHVAAPFDGIVTAHLASVGSLVAASAPTKLATVIQLRPIYVNFNIGEQDVLRIRASLAARGEAKQDVVGRVPVEVGLQNEATTPHVGTLDYISPLVDSATGTLAVRGIFANDDRALLPGNFVRVRVPVEKLENAMVVPDTAVGADQAGSYVLVVDAENTVQRRRVAVGVRDGDMRVIEEGLKSVDRVVSAGLQRAAPGRKVDPQLDKKS